MSTRTSYGWFHGHPDVKLLLKTIKKYRGSAQAVLKISAELGWSKNKTLAGIKWLRNQGEYKVPTFAVGTNPIAVDELVESTKKVQELLKISYNKSLPRDVGIVHAIFSMMKEKAKAIEYRPPAPRNFKFGPGREQDAVLLLSDAQIGTKVALSEVGNLGEFNWEVFIKRRDKLLRSVVSILRKQQASTPIRRFWILELGDMIEGHNIFKGQPYRLDMHAAEAVIFAAEQFAKFEISLLDEVEEIVSVGVPGNHGIPGGRGSGDVPTTLNFDWLYYKYKEALNQNYSDRITRVIPDTWFQLLEIQDHLFLVMHGDGIPSYMSLPYYGIDRVASNYMQTLGQTFHYFVIGHFHQEASIPMSYGEKIINGCWPGPTSFILKRGPKTMVWPTQRFFGVHPDNGITWQYRVHLTEPEERQKFKAEIFRLRGEKRHVSSKNRSRTQTRRKVSRDKAKARCSGKGNQSAKGQQK